ncbi:MAG: ParB/RepB/Spo0J family partition protein [Planctomycetota bacterium]|nr:MAG: ParB/RepB/Spo0J family partition protein [Planctomycetota bacterium]
MSEATKRLGRGLDELLAEIETAPPSRLLEIVPEAIDPNPAQPRHNFAPERLDELVDSIARHGILQPLVVRDGASPGRYELIAGERRLRAARRLGLATVPAIRIEVPDERLLELALVENLQRQSLDPIEEAHAYRRLLESYGYTQDEVAQRVGRSRSAVANALRLLELPEPVKEALRAGKLTAGHGRALAGLRDPALQQTLAQRAIRDGMSVREIEAAVQRHKGKGGSPRQRRRERRERPPYLEQLETELARRLGTRVRIEQRARARGRIVIDFHDDEQFEHLLERLS